MSTRPAKRMVAPFKNLVFTSTGLEPELTDEIGAHITDMGGTYKRDLMSDLTHMLVADRYTEKFRYSVKCRPDVAFIRPSFIYEFYAKWSSGLDFNIDEEFEHGRLKVFEGMHLTITNVDEAERQELIELVQKNEGKAGADLRKQTTNYLLTPKAKGKKYEAAINWKIPVLRPEWIRMSVKRGAILGEEYFTLDVPEDQVGKHAVQDWSVYDQDQLRRVHSIRETKSGSLGGIRKPRPDPSTAWNSILDGLDKAKSTMSIATEPVTNKEDSAWDKTVSVYNPRGGQSPQKASHTNSYLSELKNEEVQLASHKGIFSGVIFMLLGFEMKKAKILTNVIVSHHGTVTDDYTDVADFVVVNSLMPVNELPSTLLSGVQGHVVTEWMIERSLHKKKLVHDIWSTFIPHRDISGFKNINISISGFSGIKLLHLERLIALVGAQYQPVFVESRDILISRPKSKKFGYALAWKVPIVNENWLWQCAIQGSVLPLDSEEFVLDGRHKEGRILQPKDANSSLTTRLGITSAVGDNRKKRALDEHSPLTESDAQSGKTTMRVVQRSRTVVEPMDSESHEPAVEELPHKRRLIGRASASSLPTSNKDAHPSLTAIESMKGTMTDRSVSSKAEGQENMLNNHVLSQVSYLDSERLQERSKLFEALGEAVSIEATEEEEEMRPAVDLFTTTDLPKSRRTK